MNRNSSSPARVEVDDEPRLHGFVSYFWGHLKPLLVCLSILYTLIWATSLQKGTLIFFPGLAIWIAVRNWDLYGHRIPIRIKLMMMLCGGVILAIAIITLIYKSIQSHGYWIVLGGGALLALTTLLMILYPKAFEGGPHAD